MTDPLYEPGEIDEEAYGPPERDRPPLPKPKWRPTNDRERRHFIKWCCLMLEREKREQDLESVVRELQADEESARWLRDIVDGPLYERLRAEMPYLTWDAFRAQRYGPSDSARTKNRAPGIKPNLKVALARIDNARLTSLFKKHFDGNYRRPCAPSRIDVLRARHGLAEHECETIQRLIS